MEEVAELKRDLLKLKAVSKTTGDSATVYQKTIQLGGFPTDYDTIYRWDIYVTPAKNPDNAIFTAEPVGGYMFQTGDVRYPFINSIYPLVDANSPLHFIVPLFYLNQTYMEIHGTNAITITSNVPFDIISYTRTSISRN